MSASSFRTAAVFPDLAILDPVAWKRLSETLPDGAMLKGTINGRSMWPFLLPGDRVCVRRDRSAPTRGGVVIAYVGGRLIAHRVVASGPKVTLQGDTSPFPEEVDAADVLGRVVSCERLGFSWPVDRGVGLASGALAATLAPLTRKAVAVARPHAQEIRQWLGSPALAFARRGLVRAFGPVTVAPATAADLEPWAAFMARHSQLPSAEFVARLFERVERGETHLVVARQRSRVVGAAQVTPHAVRGTQKVSLVAVAIGFLYRGMGVGSKLLACLEASARRAGLPALRAEIRRDNRASIALFSRMGFSRVDDEEMLESTGRARTGHLVFHKQLSSA